MSKITAEEVWSEWELREKDDPNWQELYKNYESWRAWRESFLDKYNLPHPETLDWREETYDQNPLDKILKLQVGPFKGWRRYYDPKETADPRPTPISTIIQSPDLQANGKINEIIAGIQNGTIQELTLIILENPDGSLILTDGCHSASALAQLAAETQIRVHLQIGSTSPCSV